MSDQPNRPQFDDLARQLADTVPKNLRALGQDLEKNFRSLLQAGFERMDLVTREEFDLQTAVLERTREKLEQLEKRLDEIEAAPARKKPAGKKAAGTKATGDDTTGA